MKVKPAKQIDANRRAEDEALRLLKARGTPPEQCGDAIPVCPARGPILPWMPTETYRDVHGKEHTVRAARHHAGRVRDVFDRLGSRLDPGQVAVGRHYAALTEELAGSGLGAVSLDGAGGGGGRDDVLERRLTMRAELDAMQARIGGALALDIRNLRPSARDGRRAIPLRALVDLVCLSDMMPGAVLLQFGWAKDAAKVKLLTAELAQALDNMGRRAPRYRPGTHIWHGS
ncbi:hypothetical protein N0B44_15640 [Roseibacterium beibuensis]|uniref:Uncharacterized protein n=1 Tax=[Roseibacterium] beibuensis TaxID=1193142 RepID=A0ABP9LBX2_9RHOB|nr:hypothetical protein [Roseibacterium beibuensis]MCS6624352.1 hypothetical protein [Roseibacterium beibuensis]